MYKVSVRVKKRIEKVDNMPQNITQKGPRIVYIDKLKNKIKGYKHITELVLDYDEYVKNVISNTANYKIKKLLLLGCNGDEYFDKINVIFPNLEELSLSILHKEFILFPLSLKKIPLKKLSLNRCNIIEITNLPSLEYLNCLFCTKLRRVYCIPNIIEINIIGSYTVFDDLKKMTKLEKLTIDNVKIII